MTLLAFATDRRAAVDVDRKAAAPAAADAPCSNRSISLARGLHGSKPAARRSCGARWDRQTDGRPTVSNELYKFTTRIMIGCALSICCVEVQNFSYVNYFYCLRNSRNTITDS